MDVPAGGEITQVRTFVHTNLPWLHSLRIVPIVLTFVLAHGQMHCRDCQSQSKWGCDNSEPKFVYCSEHRYCLKKLTSPPEKHHLSLFLKSDCASPEVCMQIGNMPCDKGLECSRCCANDTQCDLIYDFPDVIQHGLVEFRFDGKGPFEKYMSDPMSTEFKEKAQLLRTTVAETIAIYTEVKSLEVSRFEPLADGGHRVVMTVHLDTREPSIRIEMLVSGQLGLQPMHRAMRAVAKEMSNKAIIVRDKKRCPKHIFVSKNRYSVTWPASYPTGEPVHAVCEVTGGQFRPDKFATRTCNPDGMWATASYANCSGRYSPGELPMTWEVTPDNALYLATHLKETIRERALNTSQFTVQEMFSVAKLMDLLATDKNGLSNETSTKLLEGINEIIKMNPRVLHKTLGGLHFFERFRNAVRNVSNSVNLTQGLYSFAGQTIAMVALSGNPTTVACSGSLNPADGGKIVLRFENDHGLRHSYAKILVPLPAVPTAEENDTLPRLSITMYSRVALFSSLTITDLHAHGELQALHVSRPRVNKIINSWIIDSSVYPGLDDSRATRVITQFRHLHGAAFHPECVTYRPHPMAQHKDWIHGDCRLVNTTNSTTTCACKSMGVHGLLMQTFSNEFTIREKQNHLGLIVLLGCSLSSLATLSTIVIYVCRSLQHFHKTSAKMLMNKCWAFTGCNTQIVVAILARKLFEQTLTCRVSAVLLHFFLLASFTWTAAEAAHLKRAVLDQNYSGPSPFWATGLAIWSLPGAITALTFALTEGSVYGHTVKGLCWLSDTAMYATLAGPVLALTLISLLTMTTTVVRLLGMTEEQREAREATLTNFYSSLVVMTWLLFTSCFGAQALLRDASVGVSFIYALANTFMGVSICLLAHLLPNTTIHHSSSTTLSTEEDTL